MDNQDSLRVLADLFIDVQKLRTSMGNKLSAIERGADTVTPATQVLYEKWFERFQDLEQSVVDDLKEELEWHPAWPWLQAVKGCSHKLGGKILGLMGDMGQFGTVSKLWRATGYGMGQYYLKDGWPVAPVEGWQWRKKPDGSKERVRTRPEQPEGTVAGWHRDIALKGWCLPYNRKLKTALYLLGIQFLRNDSPYRKIYDIAKEHYEHTHPEWTQGHRDSAARRAMVKIFLAHLWEAYREAVGLPIRQPYVEEKLGHTTIYRKEDFVEYKLPTIEFEPEEALEPVMA